jgi:hypothetical protein
MPNYSWITWQSARQALAARLADPTNAFWSDVENGLYLAEALRTWAALTEIWNADFAFSPTPQVWYDIATMVGSPRIRTLTDDYLYRVMQYHLLEPSSGGTWTGTSQFTISDFSGALQRRRDEMIQASGCNLAQLTPPIASVPNTRRTIFPDSTLEPRRARFVPDSGLPNTMTREDSLAWDSFESTHLQTSRTPQSWSVITGPPLAMDLDTAPNIPGTFDVIALQAGLNFVPPAPTLLSLPDDWAALAKWGALADLLGRDSEATDHLRANYCLKRFNAGLKIMAASNWLLSATINGIPCDTPSVREMDGYSAEWEENPDAWPSLITAGMDLCAPCPVNSHGVSLVLIGNAPIPVLDDDFVQISRDTFDAILDEAQFLASLKQGGAEFVAAQALDKNFFTVAAETNTRLAKMGLFADMLHLEGERQNIAQPR